MLNEGEGNDHAPRKQGARAWQNQGHHGHDQCRQGNWGLTSNEDDSPGLKDVSHDSKATSMIGQGNINPNNTSGQHERSLLMLVLPT